MAKQRKLSGKSEATGASPDVHAPPTKVAGAVEVTALSPRSVRQWLIQDNYGVFWILTCLILGGAVGFLAGAGVTGISGAPSTTPKQWKQDLGDRIRNSDVYLFLTFRGVWENWLDSFAEWAADLERDLEAEEYAQNPSHPRVFAVLREAVIREKGGHVHHDLGFMVPAPSGAARGIGMIKDSYQSCQSRCLPGIAEEKLRVQEERRLSLANNETYPLPDGSLFRQEEVLLRIPLNFQMTRNVALNALLSLIPASAQKKASLHELDDAALLVLILAHERGVGRFSRWMPYIASLPSNPSCGYSKVLRPYMLDAIYALRHELGVDVTGWPDELERASDFADRMSDGLNVAYGAHIKTPDGTSSYENIQWALCQVASRATAGSEKHGSLRLVPVLDLINHDSDAGGFVELTGRERMADGHFIDAAEDDSGAFVVRSLRHGRRKSLRKGQELMANYNVPNYTPLDWFVSLGFLPPERWTPWQKIEPALPRVRRDGRFAKSSLSTSQLWEEQGPEVLQRIKNSEL
jgi:hypothetical protein